MKNFKAHRIALFICSGAFLIMAAIAALLIFLFDAPGVFIPGIAIFAFFALMFLLVAIFFKEKTARKATVAGFIASFLPFVAFIGILIGESISHGISDFSEFIFSLFIYSVLILQWIPFVLPGVIYLLVLMILCGKKKKAPAEPMQEQ